MAGIVTYASSKMKQRVGDGECVRLVEAALSQAGKKTTRDYDVLGNSADYVWGNLVASDSSMTLDVVLPGDIVQFRNHVMTVNVTTGNGGGSIVKHRRPHHTAIIASKGIRQDDYHRRYYQFSILEQNQDGKKYVIKSKVQFQKSDVTAGGEEILTESSGSFWIYRPVTK